MAKPANTTSNDMASYGEALPKATFSKAQMEVACVRLLYSEPFWGAIFRALDKTPTEDVPTAAVAFEGGRPHLWWNEDFMGNLPEAHVNGILKHEAMHLVLEHTTKRRLDPHLIHNIAADLAINCEIPRHELPKGGLIPGVPFEPLTPEKIAKMRPEAVARYERVSEFVANAPPFMATEWYFARLMEDPELKEAAESLMSSGAIAVLDEHGKWASSLGDLSEEERALVEDKIRKIVADAVAKCDRTGNWGSVPAHMREKIRESLVKTVDWGAVLRQFCGNAHRADRKTSWTRLNKRYPGMCAGPKRAHMASIAVYIDQSGSVGDADLARAFSELAGLGKKIAFTTFHFDTEVDEESKTEWRRGRKIAAERTRMGGTCFGAPTRHVHAQKGRFDAYIIITDGEAPKPPASHIRRCWLLVPSASLLFDKDANDVMVTMSKVE